MIEVKINLRGWRGVKASGGGSFFVALLTLGYEMLAWYREPGPMLPWDKIASVLDFYWWWAVLIVCLVILHSCVVAFMEGMTRESD